jgi:hypothetical protein
VTGIKAGLLWFWTELRYSANPNFLTSHWSPVTGHTPDQDI